MDYEAKIAELKSALKQRDARIRELTGEREAHRALVAEVSEQMKDMNAAFERWIEAFDREINERGEHHWNGSLMQRYDELVSESRRLLRCCNKFVPQYSAGIAPRRRNFGRPLAANPSQRDNVRGRRKAAHSLRATADEIRTITNKTGGVDRATLSKLERILPDRLAAAQERANKRLRDEPPRHISEL
jgi:hypothetical protein